MTITDLYVECDHGSITATCLVCTPTPKRTIQPGRNVGCTRTRTYTGALSKQDMIDQVTDRLALPTFSVSTGSTEPLDFFLAVHDRFGLTTPSPATKINLAAEVVTLADGAWEPGVCDSTGTDSGGGSTITAEGMRRYLTAVTTLDALLS